METLAVIDFETTGLGAGQGGRATEIAAVLVEGGQIVGRFQSLMNSGAWLAPFITQLTGITNAMLQAAPPARLRPPNGLPGSRRPACPRPRNNHRFRPPTSHSCASSARWARPTSSPKAPTAYT